MKLLKSIWMLKEEIKIFGVKITSSLIMVKDSYESVHIDKYPRLYKKFATGTIKSLWTIGMIYWNVQLIFVEPFDTIHYSTLQEWTRNQQ